MKPDLDPLKDLCFESTLKRLRELESPSPKDGFSDAVLEQINRKPAHRSIHFSFYKKAVAAVAVGVLVAGIWWTNHQVENTEQTPLQILMASQGADGRWSPGGRTEHERYDTGVTALVLVALLQADEANENNVHQEAIDAGMAHLLRQQAENGSFRDSSSRTPYTQYLAGMALQLAVQKPNAPEEWHAAAEQAGDHLPPVTQMVRLNQQLAHPESFPPRWAEAGGTAAMAAIQLLQQ